MRVPMSAIATMTIVTILTAVPSRAQTNTDYPVCMRLYTIDGDQVECNFTSLQQCAQSASGRPATCAVNPFAKPAPVPTAPIDPPQPAARPKR